MTAPAPRSPDPQRPPTGARIVAQVVVSMVAAFVFAMGTRFLMLLGLDALSGDVLRHDALLVTLWFLPIAAVALAAAKCGRRGWKGAAIGLWIYVGLGILSTSYCGVLAAQF